MPSEDASIDELMGQPHMDDTHGGDPFGLVANEKLIQRDQFVGWSAAMADITYIGLEYAQRVERRLQDGNTGHTQFYADSYALCVEGVRNARARR